MKRDCWVLTVFIVICLLLQFGCKGQAKVTSTPKSAEVVSQSDADGDVPEITFDETVHDFGEVGPGSKNKCEFRFTNTGKGLLKVDKKIKTSCGCTVPELDKEEYTPGESGIIKVSYHVSSKPGESTKHMYVKTNDKNNPKVTLDVKAKVVKKVDYKPAKLKISLKAGEPDYDDITLKSLDENTFAIKSFTSTGNLITYVYDPAVKAKEFIIKPKINMKKFQKTLRGSIKIGLTHPGCNRVVIPFEVLPEFTVTPSVISLLRATPGKQIERELWVLNNYGEEFEIGAVTSRKDFVKVLEQKKFGKRYKFKVQITPPPKGESNSFSDKFLIKIKDGSQLEVVCRGYYAK
ncbi:MAG: DUF1573 domain-containing protein [Planctomycetes bacterium]|nr:DUF1573 domain-containing protein [Planctomycetota bacterium]